MFEEIIHGSSIYSRCFTWKKFRIKLIFSREIKAIMSYFMFEWTLDRWQIYIWYVQRAKFSKNFPRITQNRNFLKETTLEMGNLHKLNVLILVKFTLFASLLRTFPWTFFCYNLQNYQCLQLKQI